MPTNEPKSLDELYQGLQTDEPERELNSESNGSLDPNLDLDQFDLETEDSEGESGESQGGYSEDSEPIDLNSSKKLKDLERGYQAKYRELANLRKELKEEIGNLKSLIEDIKKTKSPDDSDEVDIEALIGDVGGDPDKRLSRLEKELLEVRERSARAEARVIIQNAAEDANKRFKLNLTPEQYAVLVDKIGVIPKDINEAVRLVEIAARLYASKNKDYRLGEQTLPESGPARGSGARKDLAPKDGESFRDFFKRLPE